MADLSKALLALPRGFNICLTNPKVRRLAIRPWLVGIFAYLLFLASAYYSHPIILDLILGEPSSYFKKFLYYLLWVVVALLLLVVSSILSMVFVLITTAIFQTEIALAVLREKYNDLGTGELISETKRTIWVECTKLLWIVPFIIFFFIIGLIPPLTPFALAANFWLIAYQFVDVVLDLFKLGTRKRFSFAKENWLFLITIGGCISLLWAIPFVGILIPPIAIAGTAWALDQAELLPK